VGRSIEPLSGLDATFLAMETSTSRLHVAGVLVLDAPGAGAASEPGDRASPQFETIRAVVGERLDRVPRLLRRAVRVPLGLQRPFWVDDAEFDLDAHVRPARVAAPGGRRELDGLIGEVLSRPLPLDRPLWEMVVAGGLAHGRTAVVARLHHAILDGVSGATALAAFLDLEPRRGGGVRGAPAGAYPSARGSRHAGRPHPSHRAHPLAGGPHDPPASDVWRYAATSFAHQPDAALELLRRGVDALVGVTKQNRELSSRGLGPPPAPFSAPRTSLNGSVTCDRHVATFSVPLSDFELVRAAPDVAPPTPSRDRSATVNEVILAAVGGALRRYLLARDELPDRPLVALVPVSTHGRASVPAAQRAQMGNSVSGMLVPLGSTLDDPLERLRAVATASRVAKLQEDLAGGEFLECLLQVVPPFVVSGFMRAAGRTRLFDRCSPPLNVVVSSVVVPDVSLWLAGCPVSAIYPAGPVADGVGLNITSMTYKGTVHFGVVASPRLVPDVDEVATLLDDAVAELVAAALDTTR